MANVSHASLTGANLHEPKGVATASSGQIYVANGAGSGAWTTVEGLSITGMIADFTTPLAPAGWLECDGTAISTTTYSALYNAMSIQQTGTRGAGSPTITGLSSTTGIKAGYYVFGTGIASGTTVLSVDSASQITMSGNAASSGSATVAVSPWLLNTGTITLPNLTTAGRFRRSRTSSTIIGATQADQNKAHTHATDSQGSHAHVINVSDPGHLHHVQRNGSGELLGYRNNIAAGGSFVMQGYNTGSDLHNVAASNVTGITASSVANGAHTHTALTDGGTETRPLSIIVLTCVKT